MAVSFEILNNLQVQGVLTVSSISSSGLSLLLQNQSGNVLVGNTGNLANTNGALIAAGAGVFKGGLGATPSGKYIACEVSLSQCIISAKNGPDLEKMYYNASEHVFTNYPIVCTTLLGLPLLQLNLVNTSTGTNASSIFRFNVGTSTATLQAYNNTHSTLAGQLRISTSAGNIVIIPSNAVSTTFSSTTVAISLTTASTSSATGALTVSGGLGVGGAIYSNDIITGLGFNINGAAGTNRRLKWQTAGVDRWVLNTTNAAESGADAGSNLSLDHYSDAGIYLGSAISISRATGNVTISSTTDSSNFSTGALVVNGGVGIAKTLWCNYLEVGGSVGFYNNFYCYAPAYLEGDVQITSFTASNSISTGALVVSGGVGIGEKLNVAGNSTIGGTLTVNGAGGTINGRWVIRASSLADIGLRNTSGVSASRNIYFRQNSDGTFKFISENDAGVITKDNIITASNNNGAVGIGVIPGNEASSLTVAGPLYVSGSVLNLTNVNTGQTVLTVENTSNGATAGASLSTSNGTSGLKVTTWSSTYSGRTNQSWIYTTTSQSLKLGTNNTAWLSILSSGVVQILSDIDGTNSTGALMLEGGMFVGKSIYCLESFTCISSLNSGNISSTGNLSILGSATIGGDINFINSTGASVLSTLNSKSPRQGLVFDGTAGVTVTNVSAFRTNSFTVAIWVNPKVIGSTQYLVSGASGAFSLVILSDGRIQSGKMGGSNNTASTGTIAAGKNALIIYIRSGNTATYYINGVFAGNMTDAQDYTVAVSVIGKHGSASQDYLTGTIFGNIIYNRGLSTEERKTLYETGVPETADYNIAGTTLNTANFVDVGGGSTLSGNSATGVTVVRASASSYIAVRNGGINARPGQRFRLTGTLTLNAGKTVIPVAYVDGTASTQVPLTAGAFSVEIVTPASGGTINGIILAGNGDQNWTLSNFSAISLGVILAPDTTQAGGGSTWYDTSGKYSNIIIPATGVKWNVVSSEKVNALETSGTLTSNGNFYCYNNGYVEGNLNVQADITVVSGVKSQAEIQTESHFNLYDGIASLPSPVTGFASIYIDGTDGDLKIRFSDGTIKTIVTDT